MQMSVEGQNIFDQINHEQDNGQVCCELEKSGITTMMRTDSSNLDHEEFIVKSPSRSSDLTLINQNKVTQFEKTGELLKRMKRQLSTQALQKTSNKDSSKINDKLTTQYSYGHLRTNEYLTNWKQIQKDEMTQAIMDEYEKQILRLKAELDDVKEEKKQVKQTLQKQRRFYMMEMYNKELMIEEMDFQNQKLRGKIQKHLNLQYQFQEKIRLLEISNAEYMYQLEGWINSSRENSQAMSAIYQENQQFCGNSTGIYQASRSGSDKMFMSLDDGFVEGNFSMEQETFEIMRMAHEREIQKYEHQLKNIKDYYENKLKTYRRSITPKKANPKNPIHIVDEYVCSDILSCHSQSRPQNLRNMLREQFNQGKSSKKIDDTTSFATAKYFMYPINSFKSLNGQEMLMRDNDCDELELKCFDVTEDKVEKHQNKFKQFIWNYLPTLPSRQFVKGFGVGTVASGIIALAFYRTFSSKLQ